MLPDFDQRGFLPEGVWKCDLAEFAKRFAVFRRSDRRLHLFEMLKDMLQETLATGWVQEVVIDGSFVTDKAEPGDIDVILVLYPDYKADQVPFYISRTLNAGFLSQKYRLDVKVELFGSLGHRKYIDFFQPIKDSDERKGIVRLIQ